MIPLKEEYIQTHLHATDLIHYNELLRQFHGRKLHTDRLTMYYPGCGNDVIYPLLFLNALTDAPHITLHLVDPDIEHEIALETVALATGGTQTQNSIQHETGTITIVSHTENAFTFPIPDHDIYFERAFYALRETHDAFPQQCLQKLTNGGIFISDHSVPDDMVEIQGAPKDFGFYKNLTIAQKLPSSG